MELDLIPGPVTLYVRGRKPERRGRSVKRVAVIGTGTMGAPIARRLLGEGCEVTVWNRSPRRGAALQEAGAAVGASAADAKPVADAASDGGLGLGLTAAARDWLVDAKRAGRPGQDYSAVLGHIPHTTTKGPQR
ncbi:NAD(P)-binding domain-containing protein [Streptomyces sp. P1-3]|uniref:NAD(P)-binding domain-containing protein n=1 Tax=Streptomyces sp. P1-3 TaxID=3421658 RepID=UPI003D35C1D7